LEVVDRRVVHLVVCAWRLVLLVESMAVTLSWLWALEQVLLEAVCLFQLAALLLRMVLVVTWWWQVVGASQAQVDLCRWRALMVVRVDWCPLRVGQPQLVSLVGCLCQVVMLHLVWLVTCLLPWG
jgi:hypothetical protein